MVILSLCFFIYKVEVGSPPALPLKDPTGRATQGELSVLGIPFDKDCLCYCCPISSSLSYEASDWTLRGGSWGDTQGSRRRLPPRSSSLLCSHPLFLAAPN